MPLTYPFDSLNLLEFVIVDINIVGNSDEGLMKIFNRIHFFIVTLQTGLFVNFFDL